MAFTQEDRARARDENKVIVTLAVNGQYVKGFPYQQFARTELVDPQVAKSIIEGIAQEFDELAKVPA